MSGQPQLFPVVPANNPFNPCNIANNDCGAAYNSVLANPTYIQNFATFLNTDLNPFGTTNCFGLPFAACTPANFGLNQPTGQSLSVRPVVGVLGDRNVTEVNLQQTRVVAGLTGDLPFLNTGSNYIIELVTSREEKRGGRPFFRASRWVTGTHRLHVFGRQTSGARGVCAPRKPEIRNCRRGSSQVGQRAVLAEQSVP